MALAAAFGSSAVQASRTAAVTEFRTWLKAEGRDATPAERSRKLFSGLGVDLSATQNGVAFQDAVGLGLRELVRQTLKDDIAAETDSDRRGLLQAELSETEAAVGTGLERRFADLPLTAVVRAGEALGFRVDTAQLLEHPVVSLSVPGEDAARTISHSGSTTGGAGGHFDYDDKPGRTIGNGACATNALALVAADVAGVRVAPASPEERSTYVAGGEIPSLTDPGSGSVQERYDAALARELDKAFKAGQDDQTASASAEAAVAGQSTEFRAYQAMVRSEVASMPSLDQPAVSASATPASPLASSRAFSAAAGLEGPKAIGVEGPGREDDHAAVAAA